MGNNLKPKYYDAFSLSSQMGLLKMRGDGEVIFRLFIIFIQKNVFLRFIEILCPMLLKYLKKIKP
jgi:hypothetical protein